MKKILLIPEPHLRDSRIVSMKDYPNQIKTIFLQAIKIGLENEIDALIIPGDVFDRKNKDDRESLFYYQLFLSLSESFDIYSCLGNHELTYQTMFWDLVTSVPKNFSSKRPAQPRGLREVIKIRDQIEIEGVKIDFIHYGGHVMDGDIAITHNDYSNAIIRKTQCVDNGYLDFIKCAKVDELMKYKYSFIAHMHTFVGDYTFENGNRLIHLGSLGRTKINEVSNNFLKRYLYLLELDKGNINCKPIEFILPSEEETLLNLKVQKEVAVESFKIEGQSRLISSEDVLNNLVDYCKNDKLANNLLESIIEGKNISEAIKDGKFAE